MKNKSFKYRIYPNQKQEEFILQHFGASRFIWNYFLNERKEYYLKNKEKIEEKRIKGGLNYFDNAKRLTELKKEKWFEWLNETNAQSLQATLKHLDSAYKMFFRKTNNFPRFKKKKQDKSYTIPQNAKIKNWKLFLPKLKEWIKIKQERELQGRVIKAVVSRNCAGQYFVSFTCELEIKELPKVKKEIGVDLWIKDFAICSDWKVFNNNKFLKSKRNKLKYLQRRYSKHKGKTTLKKIQKQYVKVYNQRQDFLHKASTKLINENQVICLESLNIKGMMKNHKLAGAIGDVSWAEFIRMLEYKADWYWRKIVKVDRFFPSSKTCNNCGWINQNLKLKDREWECLSCKTVLDRDLNASKNILKQGLNLI